GAGGETLAAVARGAHPWLERLHAARNPVIVVGTGALARPDGSRVLAMARGIAETCRLWREDWRGFNVLHRAAARVGGLDLGFVPGPGGRGPAGILAGGESGGGGGLDLVGGQGIEPEA